MTPYLSSLREKIFWGQPDPGAEDLPTQEVSWFCISVSFWTLFTHSRDCWEFKTGILKMLTAPEESLFTIVPITLFLYLGKWELWKIGILISTGGGQLGLGFWDYLQGLDPWSCSVGEPSGDQACRNTEKLHFGCAHSSERTLGFLIMPDTHRLDQSLTLPSSPIQIRNTHTSGCWRCSACGISCSVCIPTTPELQSTPSNAQAPLAGAAGDTSQSLSLRHGAMAAQGAGPAFSNLVPSRM